MPYTLLFALSVLGIQFNCVLLLALLLILHCRCDVTKLPGFYVRVSAPTLFMSLLILFVMIALVIGTIILNKWQLTKPLGATMFLFYFLFVIQDLARTFEWV